ncbi:hypothetical protein LRR81_08710 [Metabacillus sp. GX 13764]|uniref:hypothetical protein n=1 Tax=Metabacillus kandeliae TaxID=2900151 RepID=UPI001E294AEC|nr:hypothetical protein [Metabacillus kandeliae]MCD7034314.1 hypothetical protein [Metabacillus kandeliae]
MSTPIANHSEPLRLDLQFFAEEDMILPDDYEEQETETPEQDDIQPEESGEETTPPENQDELTPAEQQQLFKLKYNHEEMEVPYDEAVRLAQKGMNYDKVQERLNELESDPRLSFVETLAQDQGLSVPEFIQSYQQHVEQQKLDELVQQNIPEEYAKEMLETRKFREQWEQEKAAKEKQEKESAEFHEFMDHFPGVKPDQIPPEVWQAQANGVPLRYAYMEHQNQQLQSQLQVFKQNEQNAQRAPVGSVSMHGSQEIDAEDDFLTGFNSVD